ncbi:MAG: MFS transporter [Verrucomicrobiota bacterium]
MSDSQLLLLQIFLVFVLPISGMCYAVLGALKLPLAERLNMDEAKVGGLISAFGLMVGPIIFSAGFLTDAFGRQSIIVIGSVVVAIALITLGMTKRYTIAVVGAGLLAAGWALIINVANVLMYAAYSNPLVAMNLGDFLFGFGAFVTPMFIAFVLKKRGLGTLGVILAAGGVFLAIFGLFVKMNPDAGASAAAEVATTFKDLINDPIMWFCGLSLMFWAPLESATAAWTTTFVTKLSKEEDERAKRLASWTLSGFWLGFMGSRLIAAALFHLFHVAEVEAARVIHIILVCLIIVAMIVLVNSRSRALTIGAIIAAGLIAGPFFPNLMAVLLSHFSVEVHGRAVGTLFAFASAGWTVIPLAVGAVAKKSNIHRGFIVTVVDAAILLAVVIAHFIYASGGS